MNQAIKDKLSSLFRRQIDEDFIEVDMSCDETKKRLSALIGPNPNRKWWENLFTPDDYSVVENGYTFDVYKTSPWISTSGMNGYFWKVKISLTSNQSSCTLHLEALYTHLGQFWRYSSYIMFIPVVLIDFSFDSLIFIPFMIVFHVALPRRAKSQLNSIVKQVEDGLLVDESEESE